MHFIGGQPLPKVSLAPFTLHWYNFCTGTEGVTVRLRLHCSGAEVVPDSLTVYTVPVAFVNQIAVLLLRIVKEHSFHLTFFIVGILQK